MNGDDVGLGDHEKRPLSDVLVYPKILLLR